jgi:archaellum biogenesis ATPase FlaH
MSIYLGNVRQNATLMIKATYMTVKSVIKKVEDIGHKFTQFPFLSTLIYLHVRSVNCRGTVTENHKRLPGNARGALIIRY